MKKIFLAALLLLPIFLCAQTAKIKIDVDRTIGEIDPKIYGVFMFSNNCLGTAVDTYVACDAFNNEKYKGIPYLDATSVYSKEPNTGYVNVVNRHKDKAILADVINTSGQLTGKAIALLISGDKRNEPFAFDQQTKYQPITKEIGVKNNTLTCTFPPHSFTQIKLGAK